MKNLLALMLAIAEIEKMCETDNKVQKLAENLDKLNQNGSNKVQVNLTISGVSIKFAKVFGEWGVITMFGDWVKLENLPEEVFEDFNQKVLGLINEN
jgi:hypothetical protein